MAELGRYLRHLDVAQFHIRDVTIATILSHGNLPVNSRKYNEIVLLNYIYLFVRPGGSPNKKTNTLNVLREIMYVCIEVALRGVPMGSRVQLGLGEGPIKSGSNVPTPRVPSVPRHARWLILAHCVCFL